MSRPFCHISAPSTPPRWLDLHRKTSWIPFTCARRSVPIPKEDDRCTTVHRCRADVPGAKRPSACDLSIPYPRGEKGSTPTGDGSPRKTPRPKRQTLPLPFRSARSKTAPRFRKANRVNRTPSSKTEPPDGQIRNACFNRKTNTYIEPRNTGIHAGQLDDAADSREDVADQASISLTTCPCTSVNRMSRLLNRNVSRSWSMPSKCNMVACRSWISVRPSTA